MLSIPSSSSSAIVPLFCFLFSPLLSGLFRGHFDGVACPENRIQFVKLHWPLSSELATIGQPIRGHQCNTNISFDNKNSRTRFDFRTSWMISHIHTFKLSNIYTYTNLPICLFTYLPICPFTKIPNKAFSHLPICPFAHLSICPIIHLPNFTHLPIYAITNLPNSPHSSFYRVTQTSAQTIPHDLGLRKVT